MFYVVSASLSEPGVLVLTAAGGALFGLVNEAILSSFASSFGVLLAFLY